MRRLKAFRLVLLFFYWKVGPHDAATATDSKKKPRLQRKKEAAPCSSSSSGRGRTSLLGNRWRHRERRKAKQAYTMAVFSSIAYEKFRNQNDDLTWEFSVKSDKKTFQETSAVVKSGQRLRDMFSKMKSRADALLEENAAKIKWHDTDLIVASGRNELVIALAGSASFGDLITNIQTFEPGKIARLCCRFVNLSLELGSSASHSGLFETDGGLHRGFVNSYSRVNRGKVRRLNREIKSVQVLEDMLDRCESSRNSNFGDTYGINGTNAVNGTSYVEISNEKRRRRKQKNVKRKTCHSRGVKLMDALKNATFEALRSGRTVHLVGHSLAGAIAQLLSMDIVLNKRDVQTRRLHLWTFGSPEIADSQFYSSVWNTSPRLSKFFSGKRFHRYVTQSIETCNTDVIASITSKSLNHRAMRRIGGVGGDVVHWIEPTHVLSNATGVNLHELRSYINGLSVTSPDLPYQISAQQHVKELLAIEIKVKTITKCNQKSCVEEQAKLNGTQAGIAESWMAGASAARRMVKLNEKDGGRTYICKVEDLMRENDNGERRLDIAELTKLVHHITGDDTTDVTMASVPGRTGKKDMQREIISSTKIRLTEHCPLPGPHRHNWLNADGQGVDARRHVAFRSGSPKSLRAPRAVVTRFLAHARRFQTAPTSLLTLQTCGGGLRLGRVKIMNSRSGTAACIGRAGLLSPTSTGGPRACYRRRGKLSDGGSSLSTFAGTASSASALEVRGLLRSIGRNKLFSHPPIPGFVTGNEFEPGALLDSFELEMD
ncbi:hypothetical protein THAOC_13913 [Thalassiosira oceanica]|uniref:Fungal lipase-type domain-containing protein n=1 Tax=Thalassiosira oceanica TaxID=159749 RepID=K0SJY0_THAOC|nr:hypothetical protein THAOC_13913 [Thalassiosira oceanica]|eukprot:EJK65249.1 hypothetical protein THAOC_13913 [Thalassiosira oceanica]